MLLKRRAIRLGKPGLSIRWAALGGVVFTTVAIAFLTSLKLQLLWLTLLFCLSAALQWQDGVRQRQDRLPTIVRSLLRLARDPLLSESHQQIVGALLQMGKRRDTIFRSLVSRNLTRLVNDAKSLGDGEIEYTSTESWRVAYEELLRSPGLYLYRSVSYIDSPHYWQDGPGQQSTQLNLELQDSQTIRIERLAIIADHLWPESSLFPETPIHGWLDQQHRHGISIGLVRESAVRHEADLLTDLGIYGSRAVGIQVADPAGRTTRFVLTFDFEKVQRAETMWNRLSAYTIPYSKLLKPSH